MPTCIRVQRNPKIGDQGQFSLSANGNTDITLLDTYLVEFTDGSATPIDAASASVGGKSIPPIGLSYDSSTIGSTVFVNRVFPKRRADGKKGTLWDVQVEWKNTLVGAVTSSKRNIQIRITSVPFVQDTSYDRNLVDYPASMNNPQGGRPCLNSAGDTFNPSLKQTYYDSDIEVSFDASIPDVGSIDACEGRYNAGTVTMTVNGLSRTFDAKTLLFVCGPYSTIYTGSPPYDWKVSYQFKYRRDGWTDNIIDKGPNYLTNDHPRVKVPAVGKYGEFSEGYLDGSGNLLTPPSSGPFIPTYRNFDFYGSADFSGLLSGIY